MIRVSSLNTVALCPGLAVMQQDERAESKAADTGTAVGRIIELFHNCGDPVAAVKAATVEHPQNFPLADLPSAVKTAARYVEDEHRAWSPSSPFGAVVAELQEAEVRLTYGGHEFVGHVDQPRRLNGQLYIWDVKNTARYKGADALYSYAWQLAAYALAASETWGEPVLPGGIIATQGYFGQRKSKKPAGECGGVWLQCSWTAAQCRDMLDNACRILDDIGAKKITCTPGPYCGFCPAGDPGQCKQFVTDSFDEGIL